MQQLLLLFIKVLILITRKLSEQCLHDIHSIFVFESVVVAGQSRLMAEPLRGHNIEPAKFRFVTSLARKHGVLGRAHFCSGSLIAPNLVLTSAHCLDNETYEQVDVVLGAADLRGAKPKYGVHSWTTFEKWAAKKEPGLLSLVVKDLAVIKVTSIRIEPPLYDSVDEGTDMDVNVQSVENKSDWRKSCRHHYAKNCATVRTKRDDDRLG